MADPAQIATPTDTPSLVVEPAVPVTPVSPAPAAASAAATAAPVSQEPGSSSPAPAAETGATAAAPDATAKPEVKLPSDIPTLLEEATLDGKPKAEEPKPAEPEKKPEVAAKPEEAKPVVEAPKVEAVDYFKDVKLPEAVALKDEQRGEFAGALDAVLKGDTAIGVQKLFDLHNQAATQIVEDIRKQQYEVFNDTRKKWAEQVAADPEMGGSGFETTKRAVARMRDLLVPEGDRKEFDEFLRVTGAGDHPAFFRLLHRATRFFDEPRMPPPNPKPPPNIGKRPGGRNAADLYPNTNFAK